MDGLEQFKQTFFQECEELLADLEGQLLALREGSADGQHLHSGVGYRTPEQARKEMDLDRAA